MAFILPHNNAGVPQQQMPDNPPTSGDITNTSQYIERLVASTSELFFFKDDLNLIKCRNWAAKPSNQ
jgi:hypothetical protein